MPMSAREAAALGDAARLLNKASKVLEETHRQGANRWGTLFGWYVPSQVRSRLYAAFVGNGNLTLAVGWEGDAAYIYTALIEREGEAYWSVSVEMVKRAPAVRQELLVLTRHLPTGVWTAAEQGDMVVGSVKRAAELYTHENAVNWLLGCLEEIAAAGIMDAIAQTNSEHPPRKGVITALDPRAKR
jgi:hypothetical protein